MRLNSAPYISRLHLKGLHTAPVVFEVYKMVLGLGVCFKLTLTQYNQNLYQINFIEFIIALSSYALFRRLSTKSYSHVTIYNEHEWMNQITDRGT